jgi:hypothetical protein
VSRRKLSGPQRVYLNSLIEQVGEARAREEGQRLLGKDIFREIAPVPSRPWSREQVKDHLSGWDATRLINVLQDIAGRKGRRKNNRRRTA